MPEALFRRSRMPISIFKSINTRRTQTLIIWLVIALTYFGVWLIPFFNSYGAEAPGAKEAYSILRDASLLKWYIVPLFVFVVYLYLDEIKRDNLRGVFAGLSFFLMDAFNEIWNGLFYTATGYSAVWMCSFPTAYQPLMGWNIEIIFMFLILGLASTKLLPEDKELKILGINNRHFFAFIMAWICVFVEILLNKWGALIWNYSWWQADFPFLVFIIGYLPFFEIAYFVYDMENLKKQAIFTGAFALLILLAMIIFMSMSLI